MTVCFAPSYCSSQDKWRYYRVALLLSAVVASPPQDAQIFPFSAQNVSVEARTQTYSAGGWLIHARKTEQAAVSIMLPLQCLWWITLINCRHRCISLLASKIMVAIKKKKTCAPCCLYPMGFLFHYYFPFLARLLVSFLPFAFPPQFHCFLAFSLWLFYSINWDP